ncbi:MAG: hypothetical protein H6961_11880 [Chromatiaceae bacterium]|nr:hypothetical protein [Chromatiaceae bacterium]MCP5440115.1 hypothetical protein [Chromatiaceae bacterium]
MDDPVVETELADNEPQRGSGPWKLIIVVAVLTLIGVWLVPGERTEAPGVGDRPSTAAPSLLGEKPPGGASDDTAPAVTATSADAEDSSPGARARALIAGMRATGKIDLDAVFAAGQQAQARGEMADAYLLYFFAAREGLAAASLALGSQADPATRDPANSVFENADYTQAHKWYQMAVQQGDTGARDRLADLHARVERLAAGGDARAQRISLLWQ